MLIKLETGEIHFLVSFGKKKMAQLSVIVRLIENMDDNHKSKELGKSVMVLVNTCPHMLINVIKVNILDGLIKWQVNGDITVLN